MKRLVIMVVCAAVLGMPAEAGAAVPAPSPCLAGYYCATVLVDITKSVGIEGWNPGSGRLTSEPAGLDCIAKRGVQSGVCSYTFSWRVSGRADTLDIVVKATASGDSWVSPYVPPFALGNTYTRGVTIRSYYAVPELVNYISFNLVKWPVTVTKTGSGSGRAPSPSAINCGPIC